MFSQIQFFKKDFGSNKKIISSLTIQMIFVLIFFMFTSSLVLTNINNRTLFNEIKDENIYYFRTLDENYRIDGELKSYLSQKYNTDRIYSIITGEVISGYHDLNLVIILGTIDQAISNEQIGSSETTYAVISDDIKNLEVGSSISIGVKKEMSVRILGDFNSEEKIQVHNSVRQLNNTVIVHMPFDIYDKTFYLSNLINTIHLINPTAEEYRNLSKEMSNDYIKVKVNSLNNYNQLLGDYLINDSIISSLLFGIVIIFIFSSYLITVIKMVESNLREFSIHILLGAKKYQIYGRILIFVLTLLLPPILVYNYMLPWFLVQIKFSLVQIVLGSLVIANVVTLITSYNILFRSKFILFERG